MKFVAISDTHCRHHNLRLPKGDVLLHAGDISYKGIQSEIEDFILWISRQRFQYKIFIAGNHDFFFEKKSISAINDLLPKDVYYLNDSCITIEGIKIWGSPITPWFYHWAFNRHRGKEIKKHWELIPPDTDILLTHGPAYGILDTVINEQLVGCKDLLKKVLSVKPRIHVFGHIHESYGTFMKNGIRFINACVLNECYELINKPIVFEL